MAVFSRRCFVPSIFISCIVILGPFGIIATTLDKEGIAEAYEDVRADSSETSWALFSYDGKDIVVGGTGNDYEELFSKFTDDVRLYAYVRVNTGDGTKFVFITWVGRSVHPLKRAKVSTDKAFIKEITKNFVREILADEIAEVKYDKVLDIARRDWAAYGTGQR